MERITKQSKDFSQWYLDVIKVADLAEYSKVRGCMIIKPYGYKLWELIKKDLDERIKAMGVENVYFPLLIPESFLHKEKEHVEGFSPEIAVVTHAGGKKLSEPLVIRPTSETIMYDAFADWIKSYRDLPLLVNQWANIVRWEMRTRPFLRTTEFLWQEGHTVHTCKKEADEFAYQALDMYESFAKDTLAFPVLKGHKSESEKFAGALYTLTIEALARDGKAIQAGTSHNLGQNFAKVFGIRYLDEDNKEQLVWQTSWGVSTRIIGTIIVVHGDDSGLRLPPKVAPVQVVVVPIYKNKKEEGVVMKKVHKLEKRLKNKVRVKVDERKEFTPGFKYHEWEAKGVPVRVEIGPRDVFKKSVYVVERDSGKKYSMKFDEFPIKISEILESIGRNLFDQAKDFMVSNTRVVKDYSEFKKVLGENGGFIKVPWAGNARDEEKIHKETKATIRVLKPIKNGSSNCFYTGKTAREIAYFAKAY